MCKSVLEFDIVEKGEKIDTFTQTEDETIQCFFVVFVLFVFSFWQSNRRYLRISSCLSHASKNIACETWKRLDYGGCFVFIIFFLYWIAWCVYLSFVAVNFTRGMNLFAHFPRLACLFIHINVGCRCRYCCCCRHSLPFKFERRRKGALMSHIKNFPTSIRT